MNKTPQKSKPEPITYQMDHAPQFKCHRCAVIFKLVANQAAAFEGSKPVCRKCLAPSSLRVLRMYEAAQTNDRVSALVNHTKMS